MESLAVRHAVDAHTFALQLLLPHYQGTEDRTSASPHVPCSCCSLQSFSADVCMDRMDRRSLLYCWSSCSDLRCQCPTLYRVIPAVRRSSQPRHLLTSAPGSPSAHQADICIWLEMQSFQASLALPTAVRYNPQSELQDSQKETVPQYLATAALGRATLAGRSNLNRCSPGAELRWCPPPGSTWRLQTICRRLGDTGGPEASRCIYHRAGSVL